VWILAEGEGLLMVSAESTVTRRSAGCLEGKEKRKFRLGLLSRCLNMETEGPGRKVARLPDTTEENGRTEQLRNTVGLSPGTSSQTKALSSSKYAHGDELFGSFLMSCFPNHLADQTTPILFFFFLFTSYFFVIFLFIISFCFLLLLFPKSTTIHFFKNIYPLRRPPSPFWPCSHKSVV
jgi:hypothetical protein